jgi:hypothetical protein
MTRRDHVCAPDNKVNTHRSMLARGHPGYPCWPVAVSTRCGIRDDPDRDAR